MIVDPTGKPIKKPIATAQAVVFVSDDCDSWKPMPGYNVPEWVRDPMVMGDLLDGAVVFLDDEGPYYRAERLQ